MRVFVSVVALMLLSSAALAQEQDRWWRGFYTGIGVGGGRLSAELMNIGMNILDPSDPANSAACTPQPDKNCTGETIESNKLNNTALSYKLFAGYQVLDYFAIEGGFLKFDDAGEKFCFIDDQTGDCNERRLDEPPNSSVLSSTTWNVSVPFEGWTLYAVGILPISERFDFFGKVGAINWKASAIGQERVNGGIIDTIPPNPNQTAFPQGNTPRYFEDDGTDVAAGIGFNFNSETGITIRTEFEYFDVPDFDTVWFLSLSAVYNFSGILVK